MPTLTPPPPVYTPEKKERRPRTPQGPGSGGNRRIASAQVAAATAMTIDFGGRGPQERLRRARPALIFFLIGDAMLFLALVVGFLVDKSSTHPVHGADRELVAGHPHPSHPVAEYGGPSAQQHHHGDRAAQHLSRAACDGRVARPGQACGTARSAVAAGNLRARRNVPRRASGRRGCSSACGTATRPSIKMPAWAAASSTSSPASMRRILCSG